MNSVLNIADKTMRVDRRDYKTNIYISIVTFIVLFVELIEFINEILCMSHFIDYCNFQLCSSN